MDGLWLKIFFKMTVLGMLVWNISCVPTVIDNSTPKDPIVSKFCKLSHLCPLRGSHILCLTSPFGYGPACHDPNPKVIMRPDIAFRLIAIFNAMRSNIARGVEFWRGFKEVYDVPLPRGYSLWKLEWDTELATFAQMWANQCLEESNVNLGIRNENDHDFCHATEKFPYATQITVDYADRNIAEDSIGQIVVRAFRSVYTAAKTSSNIDLKVLQWCLKKCGDPKDLAYNYLQIINAANTHVGCGISLARNAKRKKLLVVCNFSHQTKHFFSLYPMSMPESKDAIYTQCGCPPNALETPDCLCTLKKSRCTGSKCSPHVLVLPLVAFEEKSVTLE